MLASVHATLRHPVPRLRAWLARLSRPERLVLLATLVYAVVMSILAVAKMAALRTYAWDLGTFSQALYTTAFQGRFFYFTADLPNNPTGSMFGAHFAPLLFLFVPVYRLLPFPATLIVIQTAAIAIGSPIVFRIARVRLKDERVAAVLALGYLLSPLVEGVNWFDFHLEAFMMVFLLAAIWSWEERAWLRFAIAIALTLACLEMAGVLVAAVGVFWALDALLAKRSLRLAWGTLEFRAAAFLVVLGAAWVYAGLQAIAIVNPGNALLSGGAGFWQVLGASSLVGVPAAAVADPGRLVAALGYDGLLKVWYVLLLFAPLLFWPLRRPLTLILIAPWLAVALTSNFLAYYTIGTQYSAFVAPMLFYAAILGLDRHRTRHAAPGAPTKPGSSPPPSLWRDWSPSRPLPLAAFAVSFVIVACPASPLALGVFGQGGFPVITAHDDLVQQLAAMVPPYASILTQNDLFPLVANRADAYVIPHSTFFAPGDSFNRTLRAYLNESDFVFVDAASSPTEALVVLQALGPASAFGVLAAADGVFLLSRGYSGPPQLFVPFRATYGAWDLALENGTAVPDPSALGETALASFTGHSGPFWTGPEIVLWPGTYTVSFRVRAAPQVSGAVLDLAVDLRPGFISILPEVVSAYGSTVRLSTGFLACSVPVTAVNVTGANLTNGTGYTSITVPLTVDRFGSFNLTGVLPGAATTVYLDRITVAQDSALPYVGTTACLP